MTREEARRGRRGEARGEAADGPDPAEDPILYLVDGDRGEKKG